MKNFVTEPLAQALKALQEQGILADIPSRLDLDRPRQEEHGHLASNVALLLAKPAGKKPRELAAAIHSALPASPWIERVEIAGPGFLNFFLRPAAFQQAIATVLAQGADFGRQQLGAGQRIHLEFVSANPTGPLHVGHGRGAAYGASLAALLRFCGYEVFCEYYVNDAGRQMDILAASVYLRYLECAGQKLPWPFPQNAYRGEYVREIAVRLRERVGDAFIATAAGMPNLTAIEDGDAAIDTLIAYLKSSLGEDYRPLHAAGLDEILADIREDLAEFGVQYQNWYSEATLTATGAIERALARLEEGGYCYRAEGALWFRSTAFGDDKDRVLQRENGAYTYFASDVAYHFEKTTRGFTQLIDMWGADHHGYIPRVRASLQALGADPGMLEVLLVQFAILYRGQEKVSMSTRAGEFVTLRQLRQEVGNDAARFFYVLRRADQHLDFDLELATKHSEENPVYYIQYAHARVHALRRQAQERGLSLPSGAVPLDRLTDPREWELADLLWRFPEQVASAGRDREPHQIAFYLKELASSFHTYYNATRILVEDDALRWARLSLADAVAQTLANGLALLGVSAPESM
ncbi:arginine--tRNA ligase [Candidatus Igneacidithiobacillus taiwanensis]|uniref:arginine--tRNA ligase n=2 Tax=Candidatus Igneacidithiobacillus taiwanensis TaxID=1945924 RepID=UPI0028A13D7F|nr:arginine--tRNA ligase [Candidatus Igneacidithiobacillus taiwanensis]